MAEIKEFVVNDRRKFTAEGEVRPDAPPSQPKAPRPETLLPKEQQPKEDEFQSSARLTGPQAVPNLPAAGTPAEPIQQASASDEPPPLTTEQLAQAQRAYDATVERLDTAIRSANPGMEPIPQMTYERVIQSLYMQALVQLGGAAAPGQQPQVDILGARQTIDMLALIAAKSRSSLNIAETSLIDTAIFELHMGFLEVTQAMARQAAQRAPAPGTAGFPPPPGGGPSIVR